MKPIVIFCLLGLAISIGPSPVEAGLFGPSDTRECVIELNKKLRYRPALSTLLDACGIAHLESPPNHLSPYRKSAKCLLSKTSEIYSAESARATVHQCTRDRNDVYQFYSNSLENSISAYSTDTHPRIAPFDCFFIGELLHCK